MGFACPLPLGMYWLTVTFALCACGNFAFSPDCLGVLSPAWESETGRERGNWDWIPRCCFAGVAICGYFWCVVKGGILGCLGRLLRRGAGGGDSLGWKLGSGTYLPNRCPLVSPPRGLGISCAPWVSVTAYDFGSTRQLIYLRTMGPLWVCGDGGRRGYLRSSSDFDLRTFTEDVLAAVQVRERRSLRSPGRRRSRTGRGCARRRNVKRREAYRRCRRRRDRPTWCAGPAKSCY